MRIALLALVWLIAGPAAAMAAEPAAPFTGAVMALDGDTLQRLDEAGRATGRRIRLAGVDAPEMREVPAGPRARAALDELVGGQTVTCTPAGARSRGRDVMVCGTPRHPDVGLVLIAAGQAVPYRSFTLGTPRARPYDAAETAARAAGLGMWSEPRSTSISIGQAAVIGAMLTAAAALVGVVVQVRNAAKQAHEDRAEARRRQEREFLHRRVWMAGALIGEINALVTAIRERELLEMIMAEAARLRAMGDAPAEPARLQELRENYFGIYRSIGEHLGIFGEDMPEKVVNWYTVGLIVLDSLNAMARAKFAGHPAQTHAENYQRVAGHIGFLLDNSETLLASLREERLDAQRRIAKLNLAATH